MLRAEAGQYFFDFLERLIVEVQRDERRIPFAQRTENYFSFEVGLNQVFSDCTLYRVPSTVFA